VLCLLVALVDVYLVTVYTRYVSALIDDAVRCPCGLLGQDEFH
jgi:hypothetical protein